MIVTGKILQAEAQLAQIADTLNLLSLPFGSRDCWQQQGGQHPNNSEDDQQLDERKCPRGLTHNEVEPRGTRRVSPSAERSRAGPKATEDNQGGLPASAARIGSALRT